jgi:ArsR family transcriptional regulator
MQLEVQAVSKVFKALGDEQRMRVVALLSVGELCVCHIESALELNQPTVSRLLAVLKNAGVVDVRRSGSWAYYRLAAQTDVLCRLQMESLAASFSKSKVMKQDVKRLLNTLGPGACK